MRVLGHMFRVFILILFILPTGLKGQFGDSELEELICKERHSASLMFQQDVENGAGAGYDLVHQKCYWEVDPAVHYIKGHVTARFISLESQLNEVDFDLSTNMQVDSVIYHGEILGFTHDSDDRLVIALPDEIPSQELDSITIYYQGAPQTGQGFGSFVTSTHNDIPVLWTLSEPYGSKEWWPCKQDLYDKTDSIDILVRTPEPYQVASIGVLQSVTETPEGSIHHWKSRYPITAYLVAIAVTEYEVFSDFVPYPGGEIEVLNYVYAENLNDALNQSGDIVGMMQLFNELAGLYPFHEEKYGHANFGFGGGMEHQTMSFMFNFGYGLMAHELAHQWFGDKITCGSWQDIWLNEGFATYFEGLTREAFFSEDIWYNWKKSKRNSVISQPDGSVYVTDTTDIYRIFNGRLSYNKAAYLLHMLRWQLGDDAFFEAIYNYATDPELAYGYARTSDLIFHLEQVSGQDLAPFFDQWFYGEGYPTYHITWSQFNGQVSGVLTQTGSAPQSTSLFTISVPVYIPSMDTTFIIEVDEETELFSWQVSWADSLIIDPDLWLLSGDNTVQQTTATIAGETRSPASLAANPNPGSDIVHVVGLGLPEAGQLLVSDLFGRVWFEEGFKSDKGVLNTDIDLSWIPPGVYILTVKKPGWDGPVFKLVRN